MTIIDKGEKHLFKKRLLDSSGNLIDPNKIINVIFELYKANNTIFQTWSKTAGDVEWVGDYATFEFDSQSAPEGFYFTKATIIVRDSRWDSGESRDISWCDERVNVLFGASPYNASLSEEDLQFDVVPTDIPEPPSDIPTQAPFSTSHTTATTASLPYTSVIDATRYDVQIESTGEVINNGSSTTVNLTELTPNTTDRWRVRAANSAGETDWSDYQSYTTNPDVVPVKTNEVRNPSDVVLTFEDQSGLTLEYERDGTYVNVGDVTEVPIDQLPENQSQTWPFRFRNAGGPGPIANITFSTSQAAPGTAPTVTVSEIFDDGAAFNRTSVSGSTDYEADVGNDGTYTSVGLVIPYELRGQAGNTTFPHVLRGRNGTGPGPDSSVISVLTKPDLPPSLTVVERTSTSLVLRLGTVGGNGALTYYLKVGTGSSFVQVTPNQDVNFPGLDPLTPYNIERYVENASGDGPIATTQESTLAALTEPTWDEASFTNGLDFIEVHWTGGGPDYQLKMGENGTLINLTAGETSYRFEGLSPGFKGMPYLRSKDGAVVTAFITPSGQVQTDLFVPSEDPQATSQTNNFTTASA